MTEAFHLLYCSCIQFSHIKHGQILKTWYCHVSFRYMRSEIKVMQMCSSHSYKEKRHRPFFNGVTRFTLLHILSYHEIPSISRLFSIPWDSFEHDSNLLKEDFRKTNYTNCADVAELQYS